MVDLPVYRLPKVPKGDLAMREQGLFQQNQTLQDLLTQAAPYDLVYERYSLWSRAGMSFARNRQIPGILEVNAPLIEEQATHRSLLDRDLALQVAKTAFGEATALIAVSEGVKSYLQQWVPADRLFVMPNGVNSARFSSTSKPCGAMPFTVGFVGSLKPWHGLDCLIEAFGQLRQTVPEARLLMVGDGPQRQEIERAIAQRRLTAQVQWTGTVLPEQVPHWLSQMSVAVAPYPASENFYFSPLKVVEYMAAGLPVIASRIGQLRDIIDHGVTGILSPPGEATALAQALEYLWRSPQQREQLGLAARGFVLKHHTWDRIAAEILVIAQA
ncbi:Glycosyltransferase [Synechocystis sp. PCC 6714]|nr:Glycosyltransferase [Synechocystis sp. PCC 6714]